jgi:hypothetical protein
MWFLRTRVLKQSRYGDSKVTLPRDCLKKGEIQMDQQAVHVLVSLCNKKRLCVPWPEAFLQLLESPSYACLGISYERPLVRGNGGQRFPQSLVRLSL